MQEMRVQHQGILATIYAHRVLAVVILLLATVSILAAQPVLPVALGLVRQPIVVAQLIITAPKVAAPHILPAFTETRKPTAPAAALAAPHQRLPPAEHRAIPVRVATAHALLLAEQARKPARLILIPPVQPTTLARLDTAALIITVVPATPKIPCSTNAPALQIMAQVTALRIKTVIALLIPMALITMAGIIVMAQKPVRKELLLNPAPELLRWMEDGAGGVDGQMRQEIRMAAAELVPNPAEQELKPEPELVIIRRLIPAVPPVRDLLLKPKTAIRNPAS